MRHNRVWVLAAAASVLALLAGCGGQQSATAANTAPTGACEVTEPVRISIATGNASGVFYALGGGIAEVLGRTTGGTVRANAAETGASVQNVEQLGTGDYQIAFSTADTAVDAVRGTGSFAPEPRKIVALARLYTSTVQVVVRKDRNIASLADLDGKRVSTGSPRSGTEVVANRLLETAGVQAHAQRLDLGTSVDGLRDGSLDALIWVGGLPTPALIDLFASAGDEVSLLDIAAVLPAMERLNAAYEPGSVPAAVYGTEADTPSIGVGNYLLARDDIDPALACVVTTAVVENVEQLTTVNRAAAEISAETIGETGEVPLAPGSLQAVEGLG
ncbi:TAXI family TRAP transporter solute-binding subunit [Pseudonocardia kongjuensis]|uniref:TAXI family TRAP transporter solute-binding subunit n=1 Tax=Pseudonocardia kongjuensis TaxID=102227 RepID=A0ABP4IXI5_9PSEU